MYQGLFKQQKQDGDDFLFCFVFQRRPIDF